MHTINYGYNTFKFIPLMLYQKNVNKKLYKLQIKSQKQNSIANDAHFCIPDFQKKKITGLS